MRIQAEITGIKYKITLGNQLTQYKLNELEKAIEENTSFLLHTPNGPLAISWWVSSKRTRSYPYSRVYNTLSFNGKKITIIPVVKDEGKDGDRDYIQWDTISLMSLLGVYVILAYYDKADRNHSYQNKITNQRFNLKHIQANLKAICSYQSDALHWNLSQASETPKILEKAINVYTSVFQENGVEPHSINAAQKRIKKLLEDKDAFIKMSRNLSREAQHREEVTIQPKENTSREKASMTITNYIGGEYYLTADEAYILDGKLWLVECKHSNKSNLPSLDDIKDGLFKMILFSNLSKVKVDDKEIQFIPALKLTRNSIPKVSNLSESQENLLASVHKEAKLNGFKIIME